MMQSTEAENYEPGVLLDLQDSIDISDEEVVQAVKEITADDILDLRLK